MPDSGTTMEFAKGTFSHAFHDLLHLGEMTLYARLRTFLLFAAFIAAIYNRKQKFWLDCDLLGSVLYGICLVIFPHTCLSFWTVGTLDPMHLLLARLTGMVVICSSITWFMSRKTFDNNVPTSLLFQKSLLCSIILLIQLNYWSQYFSGRIKRFNNQFIWFQILSVILSGGGNLYHLTKCTPYGGYSGFKESAAKHLLIEFFLTFLTGLSVMAFPETLLGNESHFFFQFTGHKMDILHTYLVRILGAYAMISAFGLLDATVYQYKEDKQAVIIPRILNLVVVLGYLTLAYFGLISHKLPSLIHAKVYIAILVLGTVLLVNNSLALYHTLKQGRSRNLSTKSR